MVVINGKRTTAIVIRHRGDSVTLVPMKSGKLSAKTVAFDEFRQEWQEAASGKSLLEVEGNIGMVLADLVNSFELASHEQSLVLGPQLFEEMREILYQPSRN